LVLNVSHVTHNAKSTSVVRLDTGSAEIALGIYTFSPRL